MERENVYSAIQPTSIPSLGNFLGALKNWVQMQNDYNCIFSMDIKLLHVHGRIKSHDPIQR